MKTLLSLISAFLVSYPALAEHGPVVVFSIGENLSYPSNEDKGMKYLMDKIKARGNVGNCLLGISDALRISTEKKTPLENVRIELKESLHVTNEFLLILRPNGYDNPNLSDFLTVAEPLGLFDLSQLKCNEVLLKLAMISKLKLANYEEALKNKKQLEEKAKADSEVFRNQVTNAGAH